MKEESPWSLLAQGNVDLKLGEGEQAEGIRLLADLLRKSVKAHANFRN